MPLPEIFWSMVHEADGCLLWIGGLDGEGWGSWRGTKVQLAVWRDAGDREQPRPNGPYLMNTCGMRTCVRLEHLRLGSKNERLAAYWPLAADADIVPPPAAYEQPVVGPGRPLPERFWSKVDRSDPEGCWLWRGATQKGYGLWAPQAKSAAVVMVHRAVYESVVGPVPPKQMVRRSCGENLCVQPRHLFVGASRTRNAATHCQWGHEFTEENTYWKPPERKYRLCRTCLGEQRERHEQKRRRDRERARGGVSALV